MIVVMAPHATKEEISEIEQRIVDWGYGVSPIYGTNGRIIFTSSWVADIPWPEQYERAKAG